MMLRLGGFRGDCSSQSEAAHPSVRPRGDIGYRELVVGLVRAQLRRDGRGPVVKCQRISYASGTAAASWQSPARSRR
jgi:hypothetical protein